MPYRITWGLKEGSIIVAAHSATEALEIVRDYQEHGRKDIHIRMLSGEELSEAALVERAGREATTGTVVPG